VKSPLASVRIPPTGIALAVPIVKVAAVVLGGKFSPVNVTDEPVEPEIGSNVIFPLGTENFICLVFASAFKPLAPTNAVVYMTGALSVTVKYLVPAVVVVGNVTVPTPVPSDPIGKVVVPTKSMPSTVTVNVAPVLVGETAKPVAVTVIAPPGLTVVGESDTSLTVRVNAVEDSPALPTVSAAAKTIVELHILQATTCSVGMVVA
jgi:hypothetical protein